MILGLPYGSAIDMWSLGTLIAELHNGMPVFPGAHSQDQLRRIIACIGSPHRVMLKAGRHTKRFYKSQECFESGSDSDSGMSTECGESTDAGSGRDMAATRPACRTCPIQKEIRAKCTLKTCAEFERDENKKAKPGRKELRTFESVQDIVACHGLRSSLPDDERVAALERRRLLQEFLTGALAMDPANRWAPDRALQYAYAASAELPKHQ